MVKNHKERLKEAQSALEKAREQVKDRYRLNYHIMAPANWINDPNGLIQWKGEYHVFYQHHPYDSKGGPIHWGHVKSKDLVYWEHLPIALAPGDEFDKNGCFSGSAVDHDGRLTLIYTGHNVLDEVADTFKKVQCLAESQDGIHFSKWEHNPIISVSPEDSSPHFRDPKVWRFRDKWYMVLGNQTNGLGRVILYNSEDLKNWRYQGVLAQSDGKLGYMFECPDFFELDGKFVLLFSPQGIKPEGDLYQNLYQNGYLTGEFDYETKQFHHGEFIELDKGFDFYAAQSFLDDKGRRIVIGWMNMWESKMPEQEDGWAGALTIPRELKVNSEGFLTMEPIEELQKLRKDRVSISYSTIKGIKRLENIKGDSLEIVAEFDLNEKRTANRFGLNVRCSEDGSEKTLIYFDVEENKMILDRNYSGQGEGGIRKAKLNRIDDNKIKMHFFIDRSSIELFVNNGEIVMTSRIYPDPESKFFEVFSEGGEVKLITLDSWTLDNIWN
ncbi:glycoside hydrolase family 32 protein [Tepidibacillus decaturensis]|uniref:Sucrose-6-phosphate hydrolase n=1 Tax=Tepidibacillus decaturensis TaxID=1413211 RepID=A0A135L7T7_9BACI|nr:glycoside hydrolase family 32 protein [Tepidibacillus decaturensis]KXG45055.1 sucrose-6-phosphate hydrolase [Tepidibacillus decaturensis]